MPGRAGDQHACGHLCFLTPRDSLHTLHERRVAHPRRRGRNWRRQAGDAVDKIQIADQARVLVLFEIAAIARPLVPQRAPRAAAAPRESARAAVARSQHFEAYSSFIALEIHLHAVGQLVGPAAMRRRLDQQHVPRMIFHHRRERERIERQAATRRSSLPPPAPPGTR